MKWFNRKKDKSYVAIRETAKHCSIASVRVIQFKKPLIEFAVVQDVSLSVDAMDQLIAKYKLDARPCSYVLNANDYQCVHVERPVVPEAEVKQAVRWKMKDLIDYPVEEASLELLDIPHNLNGHNQLGYTYAVTARNSRIGDISNRLIGQQVNLKVIDTKATALRNVAALLEQPDRVLAMLSFSSIGGLLTFTSGGELYHTRFIDIDEGRSATSLERFALELQRSLDYFDRQFSYLNVNELIIAPFDSQEAFVDYLKTALYLPVRGFKLEDVFDMVDGAEWPDVSTQATLLPVLGGALRQEVNL